MHIIGKYLPLIRSQCRMCFVHLLEHTLLWNDWTHVDKKQQRNLSHCGTSWGVSSVTMAHSDRLRWILRRWEKCVGWFWVYYVLCCGVLCVLLHKVLCAASNRFFFYPLPFLLHFCLYFSYTLKGPLCSLLADYTDRSYPHCISTKWERNAKKYEGKCWCGVGGSHRHTKCLKNRNVTPKSEIQ